MGPSSVWHYIDTIYATSSTLASQSRTSRHIVATRKADFLATLQVRTPELVEHTRVLFQHLLWPSTYNNCSNICCCPGPL